MRQPPKNDIRWQNDNKPYKRIRAHIQMAKTPTNLISRDQKWKPTGENGIQPKIACRD
jgi:hypothetical protein